MKILVADEMHFKNKNGIVLFLDYLKVDYRICNVNHLLPKEWIKISI